MCDFLSYLSLFSLPKLLSRDNNGLVLLCVCVVACVCWCSLISFIFSNLLCTKVFAVSFSRKILKKQKVSFVRSRRMTSVVLTPTQTQKIKQEYGTPTYVYSYERLTENARNILNMPSAFGVTVRFAMKANPSVSILKCLRHAGIRHIDASSVYEVQRALLAGFEIDHISLSTQDVEPRIR